MAKISKFLKVGAAALLGGPVLGIATYAADAMIHAKRSAKREMLVQGENVRAASSRADKIAKDQSLASERIQQKISQGRVRAASRRVRGGLFGDNAGGSSYAPAQKLGG